MTDTIKMRHRSTGTHALEFTVPSSTITILSKNALLVSYALYVYRDSVTRRGAGGSKTAMVRTCTRPRIGRAENVPKYSGKVTVRLANEVSKSYIHSQNIKLNTTENVMVKIIYTAYYNSLPSSRSSPIVGIRRLRSFRN